MKNYLILIGLLPQKSHTCLSPSKFQEALDDQSWKLAMMEEMNALKKKKGTWEIVDLPKDKRTVGYNWVFIVKCKVDGSIEK